MTKRVGIMVHHGLGDVISALPAIHAVDRLLGAAGQLEIIVKSPLEGGLFAAVEWEAETRIHYISGKSKWRRMLRMLSLAASLRRARLDILVMPHMTSARLARVLRMLVGAGRTIIPGDASDMGPGEIFPKPGEHKAELFARYFATAGLPVAPDDLQFPALAGSAQERSSAELRIVLAPAVGTVVEQHKAWSEASFAKLAERIAVCWPEAEIELFAAPPERPVLERVLSQIDPERRARIAVSTPPSPAIAASSLSGAACVVSACSGASHLAAWAGVPIVGLYGPTNPGFTGPFSKRLYPVRLGFACSPCYRADFVSGCASPSCMSDITVDMVSEAVSAAMAGAPVPSVRGVRTTRATAPDRRTL